MECNLTSTTAFTICYYQLQELTTKLQQELVNDFQNYYKRECIESNLQDIMEEFNNLLSSLQEHTVIELDDVIANPKKTPNVNLTTSDTAP